jgi:hypothetical protein
LIYSNRTLEGAVYFEEIRELERKNSNIWTFFAVTEERLQNELLGVFNSRLNEQIIKTIAGNILNKDFYLCGPDKFMKSMSSHLKALSVPEARIKQEQFSVVPALNWRAKISYGALVSSFSVAMLAIIFYLVKPTLAAKEQVVAAPKIYESATIDDVSNYFLQRLTDLGMIREQLAVQAKNTLLASAAPSSAGAAITAPEISKTTPAAKTSTSQNTAVAGQSMLEEYKKLQAATTQKTYQLPPADSPKATEANSVSSPQLSQQPKAAVVTPTQAPSTVAPTPTPAPTPAPTPVTAVS